MEPSTKNCPQCGGRLISGATNCLHCGALVAPGKSPAASDSGSGLSVTTIIVVLVVVLGGGMLLFFGTGSSKVVDAVRDPVSFEGANVTATSCVSKDDRARIDEMLAAGWEEIEGKDEMRCFRN